jgi:anti-sigma regulatory factor (Ser/Thr protein kinase)
MEVQMTITTHPTDPAVLAEMFPDLAGVFPSAGSVLVSRSAVLAGTAASAAAARRLLAEALSVAVGCPAADDAELLISELVNNAVLHTRSGKGGEVRVTVAVTPGEWVLVLVGDDGPDAPGEVPLVPSQRPGADACSGRGLLIVAALSDACGYAGGLSWALLPWEGAAR